MPRILPSGGSPRPGVWPQGNLAVVDLRYGTALAVADGSPRLYDETTLTQEGEPGKQGSASAPERREGKAPPASATSVIGSLLHSF